MKDKIRLDARDGQEPVISEEEEAEDLIKLVEIINAKGDAGEIEAIGKRDRSDI